MIAEEIRAILTVSGAGQWTGAFAAADGALGRFQSRTAVAGKKMQAAGAAMTKGITVPLVAGAAVAVYAATNYETAFADVKKSVEGTPEELDRLSDTVRRMSTEMPASAEEIAGVAAAAGQFGVPIGQIEGFTRTMIEMGEATNMTSGEAADAIAHFQNIFGVSMDEMAGNASQVGNTVVELGAKFAATESEIMNMSVRMAGAARTVGMTQSDVMGLSTAMASVGISAELGGTAMSQTFTAMNTAVQGGGAELRRFADVAGMTGQKFQTTFQTNAPQAVLAFVTGLQRIKEQGGDVSATLDDMGIRGVRQQQTLMSLAGAHETLAAALSTSSDAFANGTALEDEYGERLKTLNSQWDITVNQAKNVAIELGNALIPALGEALRAAQPLITIITQLARAFTNLPGPVKTFIVTALGIAAALGPIVFVVGKVLGVLGALARGIGGINMALAGTKGAAAASAGGFSAVAAGMVPVVGATVGVRYGLEQLSQKFAEVTGLSRSAATGFATFATDMVTMLPGVGAASEGLLTWLGLIDNRFQQMPASYQAGSGAVQEYIDRLNAGEGSGEAFVAALNQGKSAEEAFTIATQQAANAVGQLTSLGVAANNANWAASFQALKAAVNSTGAGWTQVKSQILSAAAAQQQQRDIAVQAAGSNTAAVNAANQAYQRQTVQLASLVPKANQSGAAFKQLAASAGLSAGQLGTAVNKMRSQGMNAGQALAAALNQQQGKVKAAAAKMGAATGAGIAAGAGKGKAAGRNAVTSAAQGMIGAARGMIGRVKQAASKTGKAVPDGLSQGTKSGQGRAKSGVTQLLNSISSALKGGAGKLKGAGKTAGKGGSDGVAQGIKAATGAAKSAAQSMVNMVSGAIKGAAGKLKGAGSTTGKAGGQGVATGIKSSASQAVSAAQSLIQSVQSAVSSAGSTLSSAGSEVGSALGQGILSGIQSMAGAIMDAAYAIAADAAAAAKSGAQAHSPSKLTLKVGRWLADGLTIGITRGRARAWAAAYKTGKTAAQMIAKGAKAEDRSFTRIIEGIFERAGGKAQRVLDRMIANARRKLDWMTAIYDQVQGEGSVMGFDMSAAQDANAAHAAAVAAQTATASEQARLVQTARDATTAANNKVRASMLRLRSAQDAVAAADRRHDHYAVARGLAAVTTATEALTSASEKAAEAKRAQTDAEKQAADANKSASDAVKAAPTAQTGAQAILASMRARVEQAEKFSGQLTKLRSMGLNAATIQDIIAAGPEAGSQIAAALIKGGRGAIGSANALQGRLGTAATAVANMSGQLKYGAGTTIEREAAVVNTTLNVQADGIKIIVGQGIRQGDAAQIQKAVRDALRKAMADAKDDAQRARRRARRARRNN